MNILMVSQHFFPDNFRVNDIAAALVKRGHRVTVLTSLPDYATGKTPKDCKGLKNRKFTYEGVSAVRCFSVSRRTGVLFRALNYASFCVSSTVKSGCLHQKFDLVMCYQTSPIFMANAARHIARRQHIPFFLYCLDLWPESMKAWHVGENSPVYKLVHAYSRRIYQSADLVGVTSKPFTGYLQEVNGVDPKNTVYLPQHSPEMELSAYTGQRSPKQYIFAFGGNIGSVQNIDCIVRATAELTALDGFCVHIFGDGSELAACKQLADELHTGDKLIFHGRVTREQLWDAYEKVDAFLLTLKPEGAIGLTVPAKLQEYMSGGRPVLAAIGGAAAELIEQAECGMAVAAGDDKALAACMRRAVENPAEMVRYAENARGFYLKHFTETVFMDALEACFAQAVKNKQEANQ